MRFRDFFLAIFFNVYAMVNVTRSLCKLACERTLQGWRAKSSAKEPASEGKTLASSFLCDFRVNSRDPPKWRACSQASCKQMYAEKCFWKLLRRNSLINHLKGRQRTWARQHAFRRTTYCVTECYLRKNGRFVAQKQTMATLAITRYLSDWEYLESAFTNKKVRLENNKGQKKTKDNENHIALKIYSAHIHNLLHRNVI